MINKLTFTVVAITLAISVFSGEVLADDVADRKAVLITGASSGIGRAH